MKEVNSSLKAILAFEPYLLYVPTMAELPKIAEEAVKKIDSKLECSICLETFKEPKLLPCFHVFCKSCLERLVVQGPEGQSLTCPTCRHNVPLPDNGVAGLQTDFHIEHLFEIRESLEKAKKTDCENCKKSAAIKFCQQCKIMMCEKCVETHQMWGGFRDHNIIDIGDVKVDTITALTPAKKVLYCSKHSDEKLKIYCETCSEVICSDCTVRQHRTHDYDLIKDVFPKHKEELVSSLEPLKEKLDMVTQGLDMIDKRATEISDQRTTAEVDICREINELIPLLNQRKIDLLTSINSQTQQKLKELATQRDCVETTGTKMSSCLEYAEAGLETGTEGEVLGMKTHVIKRIEELTEDFDPAAIKPHTSAEIKEIENEVQPLLTACQLLNKLAHGPICADTSYASGDGARFAMTDSQASVEVHPMTKRNATFPFTVDLKAELICVRNGAIIQCDVSQGNGRHMITYQPVNRGKHSLHIRVNGTHIQGSPYPIAVTPSPDSFLKPARVVEDINGPIGITTNSKGQIVIAENSAPCLSVITPTGKKVYDTKSSKKGQQRVNDPRGVAVDLDNNIYVAEFQYKCIQKFNAEGKFVAQSEEQIHLNYPVGICFNKTNDLLYVCDNRNHRIQVLTTDLTLVRRFGKQGNLYGQLKSPKYAAFDSSNNLYVTDYGNNRVQVFSAEGQFLRAFSDKASGEELEHPYSIAIDESDTVYVSEGDRHCVSVFTSQGEYITSFGKRGIKKGDFNTIYGICVDQNSSIIVSDYCNNRLQIF